MNVIDRDSSILIYSANRFDATGDRKFVGGFADRLKGICFVFALSKLVNRKFFIDWDSPSKISDIFDKNNVNWTLPEHIKNEIYKFQAFNFIDEFLTDDIKEIVKCSPMDMESRIFNNESSIVLNCNSLNFELFQPHALILQAYGIETGSASRFFRSIFDILFSNKKIENLSGYRDFATFKLSVNKVIGAQFRTGGDGQWKDPELDSIENSHVFSQSIIAYADKIKLNDFGVFLTTDSQIAKQRIGDYLGNKVQFFCFPGAPIHLERSALSDASFGAMQVALEHTALSECHHVIVGAGEFGVTAAYRGDKSPIFYKSIGQPFQWKHLPEILLRKTSEFCNRLSK